MNFTDKRDILRSAAELYLGEVRVALPITTSTSQEIRKNFFLDQPDVKSIKVE